MAITEISLSTQALDGTLIPSKISTNPADNFLFPGDISLSNNNQLIFGNSNNAFLEYSTDHGTLFGNSNGTSLEFSSIDNMFLYSNTDADGNGDYVPAIFLYDPDVILMPAVGGTVSIETTQTANDASAMLQIKSTTQGFLPPTMTTVQRDAIVSPAAGLQIYNTDTNSPQVYNATAWVPMGGSASFVDDVFTALSSGTGQVFTLSQTAVTNSEVVNHNGLVLRPGTDYTLSGTTLTILENVLVGESIQAIYAHDTSGISVVPGGADRQVQFNSSGTFGASVDLQFFNKTLFVGDNTFLTNPVVALDANGGQLDVYNPGTGYEIFLPTDTGACYMEGDNLSLRLGPTYAGGSHAADPSAKLQLDVIDKGFLLPRVTTVQRDAIASPATGLQIYNTDTNINEKYDGTSWKSIGSVTDNEKIYFGNSGDAWLRWSSATGAFDLHSGIAAGNLSSEASIFINANAGPTGSGSYLPALVMGNPSAADITLSTDVGGTLQIDSGEAGIIRVSAKVQIDSTTQGFLTPRMTTTQKNAIASPATGLIVYDTTLGYLQEYNGSIWTSVSPVTSPAGADTQVQFNNSGVFGASSSLTWNGTTLTSNKFAGTQIDVNGTKAIDLTVGTGRSLLTSAGTFVVDWQNLLLATSGGTSVNWGNRTLNGTSGSTVLNWSSGTVSLTNPLPIASGGTGTASPSLVAGLNIAITGSWPNQTVGATTTVSSSSQSSSFTGNAATTSQFNVTLTGSPVTINGPTGGVDGQKVTFRLIQDGTGNRLVTWASGAGNFEFGTDVTSITLSTAAGAVDYIGACWNAARNRWDIMGSVKGF